MKNLVKAAFSNNLTILRIHGLIPIKNHENWFRFHSLLIYLSSTALLPILGIISFFNEHITLEGLSDKAFIIFELFAMAVKYLPFVIYGQKVSNFFYELNNPIFTQNVKKRQEHILNEGNNICRKFFLILFVNVLSGGLLFVILPLMTKSGNIPLEIWTPFKKPYGGILFIILYLYTGAATAGSAIQSVGFDTMLAGLVYQMTCQIRILKDNLKNLDVDVNSELEQYQKLNIEIINNKKSTMMLNNIKQNIAHHQAILKFIENYKKYFGFGIFVQFTGNCIIICLSIYLLSLLEFASYLFMFVVTFITAVLTQTFVYCICGTTLFEESSTISTAIYMGNWYEYDLRSQNLLIILMLRASSPIIVTIGTILDLSLDTFTMISRRGYSLYAVLTRYK